MTGRAAPSRRSERRSLRRWSGVVVSVAVLAAAVLAGFLAYSTLALKPATARSEIEAQLSRLTGLPVFVAGSASFTLLPRTQIVLDRIKVGPRTGDADAVMEIDGIVADLDLWEALRGRTRIERLTLVRPELLSTAGFIGQSETTIATEPSSRKDPADPALQPLSRYIGAFLSRFGELRTLEIRDGVFRMAPGPGSLGISNANIVVAWPSKASSARMSGSYVWNGQPTEIGLKIASPVDFLAGAASALDFTLASPPLSASFDGEASIAGAGSFSGKLALSTPSLTRSIRWLGDAGTLQPDIGPLSLVATLQGSDQRLSLRDAKVSVGGFDGLGALEMTLLEGKRPFIGGTLAFDRLDLTGFTEAVAPLPQTPLDMQRRIPVDFVEGLDLDLRVSASDGAIGDLSFSDLAATVKFKDGVATLDVGDIAILGGQAQARMTVDSTLRPAVATGVAGFSGVDTARLSDALGIKGLLVTGASDVQADYSLPLGSWADLARRSRMTLSIATRNGSIGGFDPQMLTGKAVSPLTLALADGALPFQSLRARLQSNGPLVDLSEINLTGSFGLLSASGSLSAATGRIDLSGSVGPASPSGTTPPALAPPRFRAEGIWPSPVVSDSFPSRPI